MTNPNPGGKILEGVFAINKPPHISSAQVLRNLQTHFDPSQAFAPWLSRERTSRDSESRNQHFRRSRAKRGRISVKMGHGGTLDPLATGVLITGIGKGTKVLQRFLECTKTYECVVLFGAATDTYDTEGKVIGRKPYDHITEEGVREALGAFRGKIMQKPPVYSALRVEGKRLYEYMREGKEIPVEIKERPVEVLELEMMEWLPGGSHQYRWPDKEADKEEKALAEKLLHLGNTEEQKSGVAGDLIDTKDPASEASGDLKRKRDTPERDDHNGDAAVRDVSPASKRARDEEDTNLMSGALQPEPASTADNAQPPIESTSNNNATSVPTEATSAPEKSTSTELSESTNTTEPTISTTPPSPPAARLTMTVTSGFYVRSLCHDLGASLSSLGLMASLVRTRQADFELGKNVLEYEDLDKGEEVWGPKVEGMLEAWNEKEEGGEGRGR